MHMYDDIYVVGSAWTAADETTVDQLDELVFEAGSRALKAAGVRRHQIGLSVTSSLDLYDARSISSALTAPAAAGYLTDELRVEGDASSALLLAAAGLVSGSTEYSIVVAIHVPEIGSAAERDLRRLNEHVSSYTFDAHFDRPVGMTAGATLGLHAAARLAAGTASFDRMAAQTAAEITRGAARRGVRAQVDSAAVAGSPVAMAPLTELMLPAASAGVGVLVLASGVAGRRCPNPMARLTGWGSATAPPTTNGGWLYEPYAATAKARERAYHRAGITAVAERVSFAEMTDLSPALTPELVTALGLGDLPESQLNPSGGVRANHPGNAAGVLRVIDSAESLAESSEPATAVVHATDDLLGLVSSTSNVLVLESL